MANINILDDKTINQIAAGEVVERPVSVVKELVENAIDAGATNISVEIKDGGISLIRVTDNGCGIDKNNIKTAFLRHATSKIKSVEDLINVSSLGFRGEALSSIAAVSMVELLTKDKNDLLGYRYVIEGGREKSFDEVGIPNGTTFIVKNLFFNTPARRKFLKSPTTEGNYISELMERLILSHPQIGFRYIVNGKERLVSSGNNDVRENIYSIFGRETISKVLPLEYHDEMVDITGFVGKPELARGTRSFEIFFVNNRYIKSPVLSKAVEVSYKSYLMLHKYPFVVIYIDMPSSELDVNVHPAKTEIRFLNENDLEKIIIDSITRALDYKELIPEIKDERKFSSTDLFKDVEIEKVIDNIPAQVEIKPPAPEPFESKKIESFKSTIKEEVIENIHQENLFEEKRFLSEQKVISHKIIGQVFDTYWIVELDEKMYIIDQHAAHEKVLYERFRKRIDDDSIYTQSLSPAIIVSLTNNEIEVLEMYYDNFVRLGFEIEHFGGKEYAIKGVPTDLFGLSEKDYFLSVLDDLHDNIKVSDNDIVNDRIATMACKAAIKGNMSFSFAEAKTLINELLTLDNPYNCPHGRPTIISYSKQEIEKLFKRIV